MLAIENEMKGNDDSSHFYCYECQMPRIGRHSVDYFKFTLVFNWRIFITYKVWMTFSVAKQENEIKSETEMEKSQPKDRRKEK